MKALTSPPTLNGVIRFAITPYTLRLTALVWHDNVFTMKMMKNIPGYYGKALPNVGASEDNGFYSPEHQQYNAQWFDDVLAGKYPRLRFHVRSIPTLDRLKFPLSALLSKEAVPLSPGSVTAISPTHHQKMVLIDYESPETAIGYVMGHNSITDYWDTQAHKFRDPLRETFYTKDPLPVIQTTPAPQPHFSGSSNGFPTGAIPTWYEHEDEIAKRSGAHVAKPYQDVSCRVTGSILFDLNHNFCQGWQESRPGSLPAEKIENLSPLAIPAPVKRIWLNQESKKFIERRKKIPSQAFNLPKGKHDLQLMRTQPMHGEKVIKECYANMTRQMLHYMFIQNQYFQYDPWADHLKQCVQRLRAAGYQRPIYIFILTPTPESNRMDEPTYDLVSKLGQGETIRVKHDEVVEKAKKGKGSMPLTPKAMAKDGINVVMGSMWTCAEKPNSAEDYEEIYIHSKVAIVDDAAFTLGSANLNLRSMAIDSELNVLSQAHEVAYQLRADLFKQATGKAGPEEFGDMGKTFEKWGEYMKENSWLRASTKKLKSQLMPFHVDRPYGKAVV